MGIVLHCPLPYFQAPRAMECAKEGKRKCKFAKGPHCKSVIIQRLDAHIAIILPSCSTLVHTVFYQVPDSSTLWLDQCKPNIKEGIDLVWSNAKSMQRQLVKGSLDASYGKGQASNSRVFSADLDQEAICIGKGLRDWFLGGFWC